MTTHRRVWALRAGVVLALMAGAVGVAVPAYADGVSVKILDSSFDLQPGASDTLTVRISNTGQSDDTFEVTASVPSQLASDITINGQGCSSGASSKCNVQVSANKSQDLQFQLKAKQQVSVPAGQTKSGSGTVKAVSFTSGSDSASFSVTLHGAASQPSQAPSTVNQVSGVVKDIATGQPIAQAEVQMLDANRNTWSTGSDSKGKFTFTSTTAKPIAPGTLSIGATKDGYGTYTHTFSVSAGQSLSNVILSLSSTATPSAPAASADTTMPSVDPASTAPGDALPTTSQAAASGGSGGGSSMIFIVLGAVLILAGVGVLVLILMRRKNDGTDEDPGDGGPGPGPGPRRAPMPVPPGRGGPYRPGPIDATMVANANAETTLLRRTPAVDEYPDPYGAPMPPPRAPRPGYQGQGDGYGQGFPASPYQEPTTPYQAPSSGGGYGSAYPASGGGYGGGYSDPTQAAPGSGYRPPTPRPPAPGTPGSPAAPGAPGAAGAPVDPYGAPPRGGEYENRGGYGGGQYGGKQPPPADPTGRFTNYDQVYDQPRGDQPRGAESGGYGGGYPPTEKPYGGSPDYGATTEYGGGATNDYGNTTEYGGGATTEYGGSRGGYGTGQEYQPPAPRGGYESQPGGYESPGGGYESSPGGYGAAPRGGYESPDEYPPTTAYDPRTGYDGEYGPGRSRHSAPQQPPNYSAPDQDQRRSLDWLDD